MKFISKAQNYKLQADLNRPAFVFRNGVFETDNKAEIALLKKTSAFKEGFIVAVDEKELKAE